MQIKRAILFIFTIATLLVALTVPIFASGNTKEVCESIYGGGQTCKTVVVKNDLTHDTTDIKAGLADNLYAMAGIMLTFGGVLFGLSKITHRAYFLD